MIEGYFGRRAARLEERASVAAGIKERAGFHDLLNQEAGYEVHLSEAEDLVSE